MPRFAARFALPAGLALCTLLSATAADAKARHMGLAEAVETSSAIAVIHTEASVPCDVAGEHWTYSQKVFAEPKEVLKGELAKPFELLAEKDFECGTVHYEAPADYLVMLHRDAGHLTTLNHNMGALRIDGEQVEWPFGSDETIPVADALGQIRALVGEPPVAEVESTPEAAVDPAPQQTAEVMPCGYAVGRMEQEEARKKWLIVGGAGAGAAAVLLGFVVAFRRRRRS